MDKWLRPGAYALGLRPRLDSGVRLMKMLSGKLRCVLT